MAITLLFLLICVIILSLVFVMFLILKGTVNRINEQTKSYFVDKLEEYDSLISDKNVKINNITNNTNNDIIKYNEGNNNNNNYDFDFDFINLLSSTKYQNDDVIKINKKINSFKMDYNKIISDFVNNIKDKDNYLFCKKLRDKFDSTFIYNLKCMNKVDMENKIKEVLDEQEYKIYEVYKSINSKCNIDGFVDYLNELMDENNPYVTVYVGNENENYDNISEFVNTKYSSDIIAGIKIVYKNRLYDYSLNERNV